MKKYKYSSQTAKSYKELGVVGTTYEASFREAAIILGDLNGKVVLDFGSGAGRSAKFLLNLGAYKVIGVEHNKSMIDEAMAERIPKTEFHLVESTFPLPDSSCDLAFSSWVFMEMSELTDIQKAINEVSRVVKPGGRFVSIVATPDSAFGHDYVSFKYLDKPKSLRSGDKTKLLVKTSKPFVIEDHYWTLEDYKISLRKDGFIVRSVTYPKPEFGNWLDETKVPAHMIIEAVKDS